MHIHHPVARSRGGTDDYTELKEPYAHAYDHALDFVLFDSAPQFDFRHEAWPLLPKDLQEVVLEKTAHLMSNKMTGRIKSPEECQKLSDALSGRRITWRDKISESCLQTDMGHFKGKSHSDETKSRISQSIKAYWERKRTKL
jgi:hypothetical protein